jgi:hypothetical protein
MYLNLINFIMLVRMNRIRIYFVDFVWLDVVFDNRNQWDVVLRWF